MDIATSKKLAKKLGAYYQNEFSIAVSAMRWVQLGRPDYMIAQSYNIFDTATGKISAGEYLTKRDLWDLVE